MEITFTRPAQCDLERIHAFIARDDPGRAYEVLAEIRVAINRLAVYPALGRPGKKAGTRELIVPHLPYRVPYRVRGEKVLILRILYTARSAYEATVGDSILFIGGLPSTPTA